MAIGQFSFAQAPAVGTSEPVAAQVAAAITPRVNSASIPSLYSGLMKAHATNVQVAKKGRIDVLFLGDSITEMWRSPGWGERIDGAIPFGGKAVFEKYFGAMRVAN